MCFKLCGNFPPLVDTCPDETALSVLTSCLRRSGHENECIFMNADGEYISFDGNWNCSIRDMKEEDLNELYIALWKLDSDYALEILTSEKPLN